MKSHTGFQLVLKLIILNDFEWRDGRYFASLCRIRYRWGPIASQWLKLDMYSLQQNSGKRSAFRQHRLWFIVIFSKITEQNALKRGTSQSLAKIRLVQHSAAISAIAKLLLVNTFIKVFEHLLVVRVKCTTLRLLVRIIWNNETVSSAHY